MATKVGAVEKDLVVDSVGVDVIGHFYEPEGLKPACELSPGAFALCSGSG